MAASGLLQTSLTMRSSISMSVRSSKGGLASSTLATTLQPESGPPVGGIPSWASTWMVYRMCSSRIM